MKIPFLNNTEIEKEFQSKGYIKYSNISKESIFQIIELNKKLAIPDDMGRNFNVGLNCNNTEKRMAMRNELVTILEAHFKPIINNRFIYSATLMDKYSHKHSIVPAHQDWTYTDEEIYDSIMCWIPLVDVNFENGALGFVPKSHKLFDYIRYFPFPNNTTPVDYYNLLLMSYFDVIDMKAGEIIFFNNKTVHGSFPNFKHETRMAVALSFGIENEPIYSYLKNPIYNKVSKYKVVETFMHKYNNDYIKTHINNKKSYDFDYELIDEIEIEFPKYTKKEMEDLLEKNSINKNKEYANYLQNAFGDLLSLNETTTIKLPKQSYFSKLKSILLK